MPISGAALVGWVIACGSARVFTVCITALALAMNQREEKRWEATTLVFCFLGGTCSSKLPIFLIATTQPVFATKLKKDVTTAMAFGLSKSWV